MAGWCYIEDIVDAMDMSNDMVTFYLDRDSGEVIPITEEAVIAAERAEGGEELSGFDGESLAEIRAIVSGETGEYVELPTRHEVNEYRIIEQFTESRTDELVYAELEDAIRGRGAFRRFKDAVRRLGIEEEWFEYREVRFLEIAEAWCERHGIAVRSRKRAPEPGPEHRDGGPGF